MKKWKLARRIEQMGPPKRSLGLKPTRKKIPNLLDKVREYIIYIRDHGDEEAKKNGKYFRSFVTKEELAKHFQVKQGEIQHCLHLLNLEGLVSQPVKQRSEDGWAPDSYYINNIVRVQDDRPEVKPLFEFEKCPICDTKLEDKSNTIIWRRFSYQTRYTMKCSNGCYEHSLNETGNIVKIFDDEFFFNETISKGLADQAKHDMNKKIAYWKKNYRYLVKFLGDE